MLYGKHRINIEEKKDQAELANRPRPGTRGGRGGPHRGGFVPRGGRGGSLRFGSGPSGDGQSSGFDHQPR